MQLTFVMRWLPVAVAALLLWPLPSAATDESAPEPAAAGSKADKPMPPSFAPGAEVTLALTIVPPEQWQLNYLVPLRLQFDEEYLKDAPFSVDHAVWDFKLKSYLPRYTAEIPIMLSDDLEDGPLLIPLEVLGSICENSGESCTFSRDNFSVKLTVLSKAPPDTKNQALSEGTAEASHRLSLP